ncbi:reverse transcriptase domain-containing protein [Tanacetum coccineum]
MYVFAWGLADMTGVPKRIIEHSLNVNPLIEPVAQKRRVLASDRTQVVIKEVEEWVNAGIVHPGYHQVQMAQEDEEKTTFYTDRDTYCYRKMPFRLKNEGATYQRLVDTAFQSQIGRNLEAYVDDMVIKSNDKKMLIADIAETVEEGKFLGYMVTSEGIRANPNKTKAIADMKSPRTLKEMQRNNEENKDEYRWTESVEKAFQEMKQCIMGLPLLTTPVKEEMLWKHAKYSVDLEAYNIAYEPRSAIKGQVLADFLSEAPVGTHPKEFFRLPADIPNQDEVEKWTLFTDGASNNKGSGAGLMLISPSGVEFTYALRLNFTSTNNEAEYEALLAGLRMAKKMQVRYIDAKVNSKLVASQINESYMASSTSMIKYLATAKECIAGFRSFVIQNIPRNLNQKADILSKLATHAFDHLTKKVLVEVLEERSTGRKEVSAIVEEEDDNWMTPIIRYLSEGVWPEDKEGRRALRMKINQYVLDEGVLFNKGYLVPMLRCVGPLQANYVIREIHMGSCGMHIRARSVVAKAIRQGYYWPTMHRDARSVTQKCDSCQVHDPMPRHPKTLMTSIMAPWPFYQWAIDYFTKWIEAKPLARITGKDVKKFLWDNIVCRFRLPRVIVTDNGTQFINDPFKGIKARLGRERAGWVDELPNVLWAHRTSLKQSNGETPSSLTYGSEAVIPAEIGMPTHRTMMIREDENENENELRLNMDLLQERREAAAIREAKYKTKMEQYYNQKVRPM